MSESFQENNLPEYGAAPVTRRSRIKRVLVLAVAVILIPLIISVGLVALFARPVKVEGTAMSPTLKNGDRIFIWKRFSSLHRGDIVVFLYPEDPSKSFIKRIIGLPGETIGLDSEDRITINGETINEPYLLPQQNQAAFARWRQTRQDFKQIKQDCYFVMGDNRDVSNDSRSWGTVPRASIYGKFLARYWSAD